MSEIEDAVAFVLFCRLFDSMSDTTLIYRISEFFDIPFEEAQCIFEDTMKTFQKSLEEHPKLKDKIDHPCGSDCSCKSRNNMIINDTPDDLEYVRNVMKKFKKDS
jgi:hypothetical protein